MVYFSFYFNYVTLAVKKIMNLPAVLALLSWAECVVAYVCVVAGVFTLKSSTITAQIVRYGICISCLSVSLYSPILPFSSSLFLKCIAAEPLRSSFFWGYLQEFCLFSCKVACSFPRMLPNTPHLCFLSLLWWCTSIVSVFELQNIDLIRFPAERKQCKLRWGQTGDRAYDTCDVLSCWR